MPPARRIFEALFRLGSFAHGGPAIGLAAAFFAALTFMFGLTDGFEEYLRALQFQLHDVKPPVNQPVVVIRKDEQTSSFINRNPGRREYASVLRFLGKSHRVPFSGLNDRKIKFADLRFGVFDQKKATVALPSFGFPSQRKGTAGCFLTFVESFAQAGTFFLAAASGVNVSGNAFSGTGFTEALQGLSFGFEIQVWPKPGLFLSLSPIATMYLSTNLLVQPAALVSIDIVLHGARLLEEDRLLGNAIRDSEASIILAGQSRTISRGTTSADDTLRNSPRSQGFAPQVSSSTILLPDPAFLKGTAMTGFIDTSYSRNRFITAMPLFLPVDAQGTLEPSFCLLTAVRWLDRNASQPGMIIEAMRRELSAIAEQRRQGTYHGGFCLPDRFIPTDPNGMMEISFMGSTQAGQSGWTRIPSVGMEECLDDVELASFAREMPEWADRFDAATVHRTPLDARLNIGNRICLLGTFDVSDADFYETPPTLSPLFRVFSQRLSGIEVNANAVLTILEKRFLAPPDPHLSLGLTLGASVVLGTILSFLWVSLGSMLTLLALGGSFLGASHLMHESGQIIYLAPLVIALLLTWVGTTVSHYWRQRQRASRTRAMFQKFVAADVVDTIIRNPDAVKPGGQKTTLTVFFSDLAGFSTISEMLTPEKLVELLNEYLGTMTQILFKHGGTLDKFIGDAVMAFWNFPCPQQDHALRGCLCALAMQDELKRLQIDWTRRGFPKVSARIGLNTADVIVGYMGAEDAQMNFTCMGDGVNLASRLEGANKEYGTLLMISEATYALAKEGITARFLDLLAVKGKNEPVRVYELVCRKGEEPPDWDDHFGQYETGLRVYQDRDWAKGIEVFQTLLARWPEDGAAKNYLHRCQEFLTNPPAGNWDGVYRLTHK